MKKHETVDLRRLDSDQLAEGTREILYHLHRDELADRGEHRKGFRARSPEALERRRRFDIGGLAPQSRLGSRSVVSSPDAV